MCGWELFTGACITYQWLHHWRSLIDSSLSERGGAPWAPPSTRLNVNRPHLAQVLYRQTQLLWGQLWHGHAMSRTQHFILFFLPILCSNILPASLLQQPLSPDVGWGVDTNAPFKIEHSMAIYSQLFNELMSLVTPHPPQMGVSQINT